MNTTTALFKKEIHTTKWFLLGGLLFFWGFPLLQLTGNYYHFGKLQTDISSPMVILFGGLFAIITASGLVCLDMPKGLYEFWRSKPVGLLPYMLVKYAIGLVTALFVITIPVWFEMVQSEYDSPNTALKTILYCHTFIIILIYSIAFCIGHILRNMTESVIISCAAALLIYFAPVLVPALESVSFFNLLFLRPPASFYELIVREEFIHLRILVGIAIILSAGLFYATRICLGRHIRIRLGLKSMCWSLGFVMLALFLAAAFSVGSNLKCLAKSSLPALPKQCILSRCFDQTGGVIFCGPSESDRYEPWIDRICEVSSNVYQQESYRLEATFPTYFARGSQKIAWSKQNPDKVYFLGAAAQSKQDSDVLYQYTFFIIGMDDSTHAAKVLSKISLGEGNIKKPIAPLQFAVLDNQTVYLQMPDEITIIDVSDDTQPRIMTKMMYQNCIGAGTNSLRFTLPSNTALSDQQRQLMIQYACRNVETSAWDGDLYAEAVKDVVRVYKISTISGSEIHLEKIADRKYLPLEKLMEYYPRGIISNQNTYFLLNNNGSLTVYSLDESAGTLKKVGHYVASEGRFYDMFLRDDGNIALVGTSQIHIVQPPAAKKN